jgi:hypothetical protein
MDLGRRLKHAFGVTGKVASCVKTVKRKGREDSAKVRRGKPLQTSASFAHFAVFCSASNEALELFMVEC